MSRIANALALLCLTVLPLAAQTDNPIVTGYVRDSAGRPIPGAEVFVGRMEKPAVTNDEGRYRMVSTVSGPQWVGVRKIGFSPARRSVRIMKNETQVVDLVMTALPVTLPELKVVEESGMHRKRLDTFWRRYGSEYGGYFITGEDLERRNPISLGTVIRQYLPHAALEDWERNSMDYGPIIHGYAVAGSSRIRRCAPAVSFNGTMPNDIWSVSDIPVSSVEAVEVYKPRWMRIPAEYQMYGRAMQCGLVIVWTK